MDETLFGELKRYVDWSVGDEQALRALHAVAAPEFPRIAEVFYARILSHQGARQSLTGGESQVGHLRLTLQVWMERLLAGPWDEDYFEARCRIGRYHVRIALPQHYMFGAMNVIRRELNEVVDAHYLALPELLAAARRALGKVLDLELAIMLHTYREDLLAQQARSERLSTFGQLVGSIGHDLRNPLGVIETSLFILKGRLGEDERARKHAERIGEQLGVANGIIGNLLDMIRNRPLARVRVPLEPVLRGVVETVKRPAEVELRLEGFDGLPDVQGDGLQLRQVFVNLIDNAVQAAAPAGLVRVEARAAADGQVEVAVEDSGPGVDEQVRRRLFEPLITTREKGNGLGLALVKRIVERHGGAIAYAPRAGAGARFVVTLPTS
ncbi:MAG TPA: protoglobin domain-containing protein [Anaeromyxobacteraceae bacterium]|jgi:signal transduction histidine kinase|nr:protoglobin domain-containing protein [Anaeromyxobacteraceae bacterium]